MSNTTGLETITSGTGELEPVSDTTSYGAETGSDSPVVLLTGAGSGIGAATALAFAEKGWTVYATDVETPLSEEIQTRCRTRELDVTDGEQSRGVVADVLAETGRLDVLVNNAGYAVPGAIEEVPVDETKAEFDVLVHGPHRLIREVLPAMREQGSGTIVNVSSVLGLAAYQGLGSYAAGKAAMEALSDSLRLELRGTGIDVVLVEPPWVETPFADDARADLAGRERHGSYAETYAALEDGWALDGGPLALSPERVADTIVAAATDRSPWARYPVGIVATFIRWTRWFPPALLDPIRRAFGWATTRIGRLGARLRQWR